MKYRAPLGQHFKECVIRQVQLLRSSSQFWNFANLGLTHFQITTGRFLVKGKLLLIGAYDTDIKIRPNLVVQKDGGAP